MEKAYENAIKCAHWVLQTTGECPVWKSRVFAPSVRLTKECFSLSVVFGNKQIVVNLVILQRLKKWIRDQVIDKFSTQTLRMTFLEKGGKWLWIIYWQFPEPKKKERATMFGHKGNVKTSKSDVTCYQCCKEGHISNDNCCKIVGHYGRKCGAKMSIQHRQKHWWAEKEGNRLRESETGDLWLLWGKMCERWY